MTGCSGAPSRSANTARTRVTFSARRPLPSPALIITHTAAPLLLRIASAFRLSGGRLITRAR